MQIHSIKSPAGPNAFIFICFIYFYCFIYLFIFMFFFVMPKFQGCAWPRNPSIWVLVRFPIFEKGNKLILFVKTEIPRLRMAPKSKYLVKKRLIRTSSKINSFRKKLILGYFCSPMGPHGAPR